MAQRITLSREQVKKLRRLRAESDVAKDGEIQNRNAPLEIEALAHRIDEETRPHKVRTCGSI